MDVESRYELLEKVGSGSFATVYRARDLELGREIAVKQIHQQYLEDAKLLDRYWQEAQLLASLHHPNIVTIFDIYRERGWLILELMQSNLAERMAGRQMDLRALRTTIAHSLRALKYLHARGVIHGDIKPANLFAAQRGGLYDVAKLLDFGLVKPLADADSVQLTQDGTITGSPLFMSPEQSVGDRDPDARGDIYSLGAVAYYMLTGRPPFDYGQPIKVLLAHAHEAPVPPSEVNPDTPSDLSEVVLRCLAKAPEDRYQDASSLGVALQQCNSAGQWTREDAARWWQEHEVVGKRELAVT